MAQQASMSTDAFEDFYFNVCNLDYSKMDRAMDALAKRLNVCPKSLVETNSDLQFPLTGKERIVVYRRK